MSEVVEQRVGKNELLDKAGLYAFKLVYAGPDGKPLDGDGEGVFDLKMIVGVTEQPDGSANYILATETGLAPVKSVEPFVKARKRWAEARASSNQPF